MLVVTSFVITIALEVLHIPAARMLGPMMAAILIQSIESAVVVPQFRCGWRLAFQEWHHFYRFHDTGLCNEELTVEASP
jgi:hypothetical protein